MKHLSRGYNSTVLNSPCYVISDAHLGVASLDIERALVAFLRGLQGKAGSLLINGDLFDFWFEWKSVIPRNSFRALAALADLRESGMPILWVAGNHDCWGDDVLTKGDWTWTLSAKDPSAAESAQSAPRALTITKASGGDAGCTCSTAPLARPRAGVVLLALGALAGLLLRRRA